MKRVLVIEDSSKSVWGGGQAVTLDVCKALESKFEISFADHVPFGKGSRKSLFQTHYPVTQLFGWGRIGSNGTSSFSIGLSELLFSPAFILVNGIILLASCARNTPDIIYTATKKTLVLGILVSCFLRLFTLRKRPIVYHGHNANPDNRINRCFWRAMQMFGPNAIAVSKTAQESMLPLTARVIFNGVEPADCTTKDREKTKAVGFVGSLVAWKGVDYLVQAAKDNRLSNLTFKIFGDGSELERLVNLSPKNVQFKGFFDGPKMDLFSQIDLLVLPSTGCEACPMVLLEAYSHNVPFITTNIGGQAEIAAHLSMPAVRAGHSEDLADKIFETLSCIQTSKIRLPELPEKFTVDAFGHAIRELFEEVSLK